MTSPSVGGTSFAPSTQKKKKKRSVDVTAVGGMPFAQSKEEEAMTSPAVGCMASAPSKEEKSDDVTCSRWYGICTTNSFMWHQPCHFGGYSKNALS